MADEPAKQRSGKLRPIPNSMFRRIISKKNEILMSIFITHIGERCVFNEYASLVSLYVFMCVMRARAHSGHKTAAKR